MPLTVMSLCVFWLCGTVYTEHVEQNTTMRCGQVWQHSAEAYAKQVSMGIMFD